MSTHAGVAAVATYLTLIGASLVLMNQLCERCRMDNAYLGQLLLILLALGMGLAFGIVWVIGSRREGARGLAAGAIPAAGFAAVVLAVGVTRTLVPPALEAVQFMLGVIGLIAAVVFARRRVPARV